MWWLVAIVCLILGALVSAYTRNSNYFESSTVLVFLIGVGYFLAYYFLPYLLAR